MGRAATKRGWSTWSVAEGGTHGGAEYKVRHYPRSPYMVGQLICPSVLTSNSVPQAQRTVIQTEVKYFGRQHGDTINNRNWRGGRLCDAVTPNPFKPRACLTRPPPPPPSLSRTAVTFFLALSDCLAPACVGGVRATAYSCSKRVEIPPHLHHIDVHAGLVIRYVALPDSIPSTRHTPTQARAAEAAAKQQGTAGT